LALTDVVVFLDCCYAGAATRSGNVAERTVEVMAATEENTTANTRAAAVSFTQKICSAIRSMSLQGDLINLADVVAHATAATAGRTFIHKTLEGSTPIVLRSRNKAREGHRKENAPPGHQGPHPTPHPQVSTANGEVELVCSIRFAEDIAPEHLTGFLEWIQGLDETSP
jgi:hypothetical protein